MFDKEVSIGSLSVEEIHSVPAGSVKVHNVWAISLLFTFINGFLSKSLTIDVHQR